MVEVRMRKREMRGDGGKYHVKLGLRRISYASQYIIPHMAGTSPDLGCNYTNGSDSQPKQESHTADISYLLVSSILFSFSSPSHSFLSITLSSLPNTKLSHPSLSLHATIMCCQWVQHTPSSAYTEYSEHWVQHTPCIAYTKSSRNWVHHTASTASTQLWFSSRYSHDYELTTEWRFSFRHATLHDWPPSGCPPCQLNSKLLLSYSYGYELTNWWVQYQYLAHCSLTTAKYSSSLAWSRPRSVSSNSLNHGLRVYLSV